MDQILLCDNNKKDRKLVATTLSDFGFQVRVVGTGKEALELLETFKPDLLITEVRLPDISGVNLIREVHSRVSFLPILVLTAYATIELAVTTVKVGASDFLDKRVDTGWFVHNVREIIERSVADRERQRLSTDNIYWHANNYDFTDIVGNSPSIRQVLDLVSKVANTDTAVLIRGSSGTGKELIARAIHFSSDRKDGPFITTNCAVFAEGLLESELFGHEKGAFTGAAARKLGRFELAENGTLFLDEIGDINLHTQVRFLRVLQEKEFERVGGTATIKSNARIIAATNRNLEEMIKDGQFREDLYYRLNVIPLFLPPLKDRRGDIPHLVEHFLQKYSHNRKSPLRITDSAMQLLVNYEWPGNIRELENTMERISVLSQNEIILPEDLAVGLGQKSPIPQIATLDEHLSLTQQVDNFERLLILRAMEKTRWNKSKAARLLQVKRSTIRYKVEKFHLDRRSRSLPEE